MFLLLQDINFKAPSRKFLRFLLGFVSHPHNVTKDQISFENLLQPNHDTLITVWWLADNNGLNIINKFALSTPQTNTLKMNGPVI